MSQVSSLVFDVELFVKIFPVASHLSPLVYIIAELIFIPPSTRVCVCLYVRNQSILFTRTRPVAYEHTSQIKDNGNIGRRGKKRTWGVLKDYKVPFIVVVEFLIKRRRSKSLMCARRPVYAGQSFFSLILLLFSFFFIARRCADNIEAAEI